LFFCLVLFFFLLLFFFFFLFFLSSSSSLKKKLNKIKKGYHWKCYHSGFGLRDVVGWPTLRYDDIAKIRADLGESALPSTAEETAYKKEMDDLWEFLDELVDGIKPAQLNELMEANGMETAKVDFYEQLYFVGAGLWRGIPAACPTCKNKLMVVCRDQVHCRGWLDGIVLCKFTAPRAEFEARHKFVIPETVLAKSPFLKKWTHPRPELLRDVIGGNTDGDGDDGDDNDDDDDDDEDEDDDAAAAQEAQAERTRAVPRGHLVNHSSGFDQTG
jgi:hypothetical protein